MWRKKQFKNDFFFNKGSQQRKVKASKVKIESIVIYGSECLRTVVTELKPRFEIMLGMQRLEEN